MSSPIRPAGVAVASRSQWHLPSIERPLFAVVALVVVLAVFAPMAVLIYAAVTDVPIGMRPDGVSLGSFAAVATTPQYYAAFGNTLVVAVFSTLFAGLIGVLLGYFVSRTDMPGKRIIRIGVIVPFFLSPFIGSLAWTFLLQPEAGPVNLLLKALNLPQVDAYGPIPIIWVLGLYYAPYVFIFVTSTLHNMDPILEEAAAMSGLNRRQIMTQVTIPLVAPAILSGMLLTFVSTIGQFGVPAVLGTPDRYFVLTTYMYTLINGFPPQFNVAAVLVILLLGVACLGLWAQNRVLRGKSFTTMSGKGFRPKLNPLGKWRWPAFSFGALFILLSSVLPTLMLLWVSFVPYYSATFSLDLLTLRHYYSLLNDPITARVIKNTLFLAMSGAFIGVLLAVIINWILQRTRSWYKPLLDYSLMIPVAVPNICLAIGILWVYIYVPLPIYGSIWILLIGYVTCYITYAVRNVGASFTQIDKSLEEAARMVGATWMRTVREVTLPLLKPGLIGAWTLLFIIFVRELSISIFLYSPGNEVLSVLIYNRWGEGQSSALASLSILQLFLTGAVVFLAGFIFKVDVAKAQG
jgi:iron(III) transport system permease protein